MADDFRHLHLLRPGDRSRSALCAGRRVVFNLACALTDRAFAALKSFKGRVVALEALAEFLLKRDR